jgi:elongation factor G
MSVKRPLDIRSVAIVGPYLSGKTTLLESLLFTTGSTTRQGAIQDGNTVGDSSAEARDRHMSVELNTARLTYKDVDFTILDCPGSVEFTQETYNALIGVDAVVVVCEPVVDRVLNLSPLFKFLEDWDIPHLIFLNKLDRADVDYMQVLMALKTISARPLVPQHYPIGRGESLEGYVDLVTEQAFKYNNPEQPIVLPAEIQREEQMARTELLETLANYDDHLLEELLEDIAPSQDEIWRDLQADVGEDLIVPVLVGCADRNFGVLPLLDALVKECPTAETTAQRRGVITKVNKTTNPTIAQVLKTYYTPQGGKLSLVRVWAGELVDGMSLGHVRVSGMYHLTGYQSQIVNKAPAGSVVALARLEGIQTGETLASIDRIDVLPVAERLAPVFSLAIVAEKRSDEVKLSSALAKLLEEDPALHWEQHGDTHEIILWGQGEIHLQVALDRLRRKYNLPMNTHLPQVAYKETIRKSTNVHGRYKHQTGGHGQFGDVRLDIKPKTRGEGFEFKETIVGGVVPRQYIPGVETGVREFLDHGPLGFPIVDIAVTLTDGTYHNVDSSEQAFRQAARIAMQEGMAKCDPILLEPIVKVSLSVPIEFTSKVLRLVSGRRGQILGYDAKPGWTSWDEVEAQIPQAEMQDLIVELRSLTQGVGRFAWEYDHLQEVPDKIADRVLAR